MRGLAPATDSEADETELQCVGEPLLLRMKYRVRETVRARSKYLCETACLGIYAESYPLTMAQVCASILHGRQTWSLVKGRLRRLTFESEEIGF